MGANAKKKFYSCTKCQKTFTTKGDHVLHKRNHAQEKLRCAVCKETFALKCYLDMHMRAHTGKRPLRGLVCKKTFTGKKGLDRHMRTQAEGKPFRCTVCKKSFALKPHLGNHMRTHAGGKPFRCTVCEKSFTTNYLLGRHTSTHTEERPFRCTVCEKSFTTNYLLGRHTSTHTGEKPFRCTVCEKSFTRKYHVDRHMITHTGERHFRCTVCEKKFALKDKLDIHMKTHTGKKTYRRISCESFVEDTSTKDHLPQNGRIQCESNDEAYFLSSVNGKGEIPPKSSATASDLPIETSISNCINNKKISLAKSPKHTGPKITKEKMGTLSIPDSDHNEPVEETRPTASVDSSKNVYKILCLKCKEKFRNVDDYEIHPCSANRLPSEATNEDVQENNVIGVDLRLNLVYLLK